MRKFIVSALRNITPARVCEALRKALVFLALVTAIAVIIGLAWAMLTGSKIPSVEPTQELQIAEIYQSPMIVAEIKTYAPEPIEEDPPEVVSKKETEPQTSGTITATITHYCACTTCNGKWSYTEDGINYTDTASGIILHDGISGNYCAATFGSLGDKIVIGGVEYTIVDRMKATTGYKIDIFVADGHDRCYELGRYKAEVIV